jgi:hypothetical protein
MSDAVDPGWESAASHLAFLQEATHRHYGIEIRSENPLDVPQVVEHLRQVYLSIHADGDEAGFHQMLAEQKAEREIAVKRCPTPYENPEWYGLMLSQFEALSRSASEMNLRIAPKPLLGTLATGRVNGVAIGLHSTKTRIILLEEGLFGFANLMCKAVASSIPQREGDGERLSFSTDLADLRSKLREDETPILRFFDALCSYVVQGHPHHARPYASPPNTHRLSSILRESMELFILGHEIGHVALGHLDGDLARHAIAESIDAETVQTNWEQEFEADLVGMHLMIRAMTRDRGMDVALSFWGAHLFFGCIEIVEHTVSLLGTGKAETWRSHSHPPTAARQERLKEVLLATVEPREAAEGAIRLAGVVDEILALFWKRCEQPLHRLHREGTRPAQWWMAHPDAEA